MFPPRVSSPWKISARLSVPPLWVVVAVLGGAFCQVSAKFTVVLLPSCTMPALLPLPVWATPAQLPAPAVETLGSAERALLPPEPLLWEMVAELPVVAVPLLTCPMAPRLYLLPLSWFTVAEWPVPLGGDARVELIGGGGADLGNGGRQGGAALVGGGRLGGAVLGGGDHVLGEAGRCQQHSRAG